MFNRKNQFSLLMCCYFMMSSKDARADENTEKVRVYVMFSSSSESTVKMILTGDAICAFLLIFKFNYSCVYLIVRLASSFGLWLAQLWKNKDKTVVFIPPFFWIFFFGIDRLTPDFAQLCKMLWFSRWQAFLSYDYLLYLPCLLAQLVWEIPRKNSRKKMILA